MPLASPPPRQVFCIICPIIAPVACFYFAMCYLVW